MLNINKRNNIKGILSFVLLFLIFILFVMCNLLVFYHFSNINVKSEVKSETINQVNDEEEIVDLSKFCVEIFIKGKEDKNYNIASGIIYSNDGYIITNDHIYEDITEPEFLVKLSNGQYYDASYVGGDTISDIALIKIDMQNLETPVFSNSDNCIQGESVSVIGNIFYNDLNFSLTKGVISHCNRYINDNGNFSIKLIQIDAPINPGFSGGPVFNKNNEIIGITISKLNVDGYNSVGFCVPINTVIKVADDIKKFGSVIGRGKLGISYTFIKQSEGLMFNKSSGLLIENIEITSSFFESGITKGDVIKSINSVNISEDYKFLEIINNLNENQEVELVVRKADGNDVVIKGKATKLSSFSSYY